MAKKKEMFDKDLSNKAVVIMLVAVIVVSVVSLGVYLNALSSAEPTIGIGKTGTISLTVVKPAGPGTPVGEPVSGRGEIGLTIERPSN